MDTITAKAENIDTPVVFKADLRRFNKAEEQVTKAVTALAAIVKIENAEQLETAMDTLSKASKVDKVIEAKRVELVTPGNDYVKKINAYAKELTGKLPPAIASAKNVVIAYNNLQQSILETNRKNIRGEQLTALGFEVMQMAPMNATFYIYEGMRVSPDTLATQDDRQWFAFYSDLTQRVAAKKEELLRAIEVTEELDNAFGSEDDIKETSAKVEGIKSTPSFTNYAPVGSVEKVKGITKRWAFSVINAAEVPLEYMMVDEAKIRKAVAEGVRTIAGVSIFQQDGLTVR